MTDSQQIRVRIDPPLWFGLEPTAIPRSSALLIPLLRTAGESSLSPELTRRVIRAAFALCSRLPHRMKLVISDAELVLISSGSLAAAERLEAERALEELRDSIASLVEAAPVARWREALVRAWAAASAEIGGELRAAIPMLTYARAGMRAEVTVELEHGVPTTLIHISSNQIECEPAEDSAALAGLTELGCKVRDASGGLLIARSGLVASAGVLRDMLEAAIALAFEMTRKAGPYR